MHKFSYTDRSKTTTQKVVFECYADNILEADKLYTVATGCKPEKQGHIGCYIEFNVNEQVSNIN